MRKTRHWSLRIATETNDTADHLPPVMMSTGPGNASTRRVAAVNPHCPPPFDGGLLISWKTRVSPAVTLARARAPPYAVAKADPIPSLEVCHERHALELLRSRALGCGARWLFRPPRADGARRYRNTTTLTRHGACRTARGRRSDSHSHRSSGANRALGARARLAPHDRLPPIGARRQRRAARSGCPGLVGARESSKEDGARSANCAHRSI